jgi:hypothetical protein
MFGRVLSPPILNSVVSMHKLLSLGAATLVLMALTAALPLAKVWSADETSPGQKAADRKSADDLKKKLGKALTSGEVKDGRYEMSNDELAMDCKRMTGSMKITINRVRDAESRRGGSNLAETAHKTVPLIMQGSTASADRQASLARERAKLDAYNRQLAARNCKTLDIDAELARAQDPMKKY